MKKPGLWKCPSCGTILRKGMSASLFKSVAGVATCGTCGAKFSQADVYAGRYDVSRKDIEKDCKQLLVSATREVGVDLSRPREATRKAKAMPPDEFDKVCQAIVNRLGEHMTAKYDLTSAEFDAVKDRALTSLSKYWWQFWK